MKYGGKGDNDGEEDVEEGASEGNFISPLALYDFSGRKQGAARAVNLDLDFSYPRFLRVLESLFKHLHNCLMDACRHG